MALCHWCTRVRAADMPTALVILLQARGTDTGSFWGTNENQTVSNISYMPFKKVKHVVLLAQLCSNEWPFK